MLKFTTTCRQICNQFIRRTYSSINTKINKQLLNSLVDNDVYVTAAVRSPIGTFGGSLSSLYAQDIASQVIKGALSKCNMEPDYIEECIFGHVFTADSGAYTSRQAALAAKIPETVTCTNVNKMCASGMKAVMYGSQSIMLGYSNVMCVGGMESMSNIPYYVRGYRSGIKIGHQTLLDGMYRDGMWCTFENMLMGSIAERTVEKYNISRETLDDYAISSYQRGKTANTDGTFDDEIIPITVPPTRKQKESIIFKNDEGCDKLNVDKIRKLKPAFDRENGRITAANTSQISDGASVLILCSGKYIKYNHNLNDKLIPLAKILSFADAAQKPSELQTSASLAIPKAMNRINMTMHDIDFNKDYFELNEAFAAVPILNMKILGIPHENVNLYGGAISLGHPVGCSGARIIVTLINVLKKKNGRYGIAAVNHEGGGASAIIIENINCFI